MLTAEKLHEMMNQSAQELWGIDKISVPYASIPEWMAKQEVRLAELINQEEIEPLERLLQKSEWVVHTQAGQHKIAIEYLLALNEKAEVVILAAVKVFNNLTTSPDKDSVAFLTALVEFEKAKHR